MIRRIVIASACAYAVMCASLSGCSRIDADVSGRESGGQAPSFSGPYALELQDAYIHAASDFVKNALADGVISDAEYSELQNRVIECWRDNGYSDAAISADGHLSVEDRTDISDEEEAEIFSQCSMHAGVPEVEGLYWMMRTNPENVDWPSAERDCLVRSGLLEQGTTVEEMHQWYQRNDPASRSHAAYVCSQDALGHLGLQ